jgi:hypothetical protein
VIGPENAFHLISVFGEPIPCSGTSNSLLRGGTGMACKGLGIAGGNDRQAASKWPKRTKNLQISLFFFPVFRESGIARATERIRRGQAATGVVTRGWRIAPSPLAKSTVADSAQCQHWPNPRYSEVLLGEGRGEGSGHKDSAPSLQRASPHPPDPFLRLRRRNGSDDLSREGRGEGVSSVRTFTHVAQGVVDFQTDSCPCSQCHRGAQPV